MGSQASRQRLRGSSSRGSGIDRRQFGREFGSLVLSLVGSATAGPLLSSCTRTQDEPTLDVVETVALGPETDQTYSNANPFEIGPLMHPIIEEVQRQGGSDSEKLERLFNLLTTENEDGLTILENPNNWRPPHTADETLAYGGTRTEMAFVVIAAMQELDILGRAQLVRFDGSGEISLIAYAVLDGEPVFIDPYSDSFGSRPAISELVSDVSLAQSASVYHELWGQHLISRTVADTFNVCEAFEAAVSLDPSNVRATEALLAWGGTEDFTPGALSASLATITNMREGRIVTSDDQSYSQLLLTAQFSYEIAISSYLQGEESRANQYFNHTIALLDQAFALPSAPQSDISAAQLRLISTELSQSNE